VPLQRNGISSPYGQLCASGPNVASALLPRDNAERFRSRLASPCGRMSR